MDRLILFKVTKEPEVKRWWNFWSKKDLVQYTGTNLIGKDKPDKIVFFNSNLFFHYQYEIPYSAYTLIDSNNLTYLKEQGRKSYVYVPEQETGHTQKVLLHLETGLELKDNRPLLVKDQLQNYRPMIGVDQINYLSQDNLQLIDGSGQVRLEIDQLRNGSWIMSFKTDLIPVQTACLILMTLLLKSKQGNK